MKKRYVALFASICLAILFATTFVFMFAHQVRMQKTFRVTVTKFGALPGPHTDNPWRVLIEQLSYEELKNAEILIDQGTPNNFASPFYNPFLHNSTIDGRAQKEFYVSWHPSNITMVWDGGSEIFLFNPTPIP